MLGLSYHITVFVYITYGRKNTQFLYGFVTTFLLPTCYKLGYLEIDLIKTHNMCIIIYRDIKLYMYLSSSYDGKDRQKTKGKLKSI